MTLTCLPYSQLKSYRGDAHNATNDEATNSAFVCHAVIARKLSVIERPYR